MGKGGFFEKIPSRSYGLFLTFLAKKNILIKLQIVAWILQMQMIKGYNVRCKIIIFLFCKDALKKLILLNKK